MDFKCHIKEVVNGTPESVSPWHVAAAHSYDE